MRKKKSKAGLLSGHKDNAVEVPLCRTSKGSFRGGPVTGKSFEFARWGARDNAAQMRQMGLPRR